MEQISHLGEKTGLYMVAKGVPVVEVMTEEMIITKLMVDGEDMVRLEGVLMPMSK